MIWSTIQFFPHLLLLNLAMLAVVIAGTVVNGAALLSVLRRNREVEESGEAARDTVAALMMRRSVRCESVYFSIQATMLAVSVFGLWRGAMPLAPSISIDFFFWSLAGRALVSVLVSYLSLMDHRDRRRVALELERIGPTTTTASGVG